MTGSRVDAIRAVSHAGLAMLELQIGAMAHAFTERLKPAERGSWARRATTSRGALALWRDLLGDEPELVAQLEALAEQVRELQRRRGCSLGRGRCAPSRGPHTKEAR